MRAAARPGAARVTARPAPSRLVTGVLLATAAALLYVSLPNVGTAIRAAQANGTPGTFTATKLDCVTHPGHESCTWSGIFRPRPGGQSRVVTFYGSGRDSMRAGEVRPAVDIDLPTRVYDPQGSREWIFTAALLLSGYALLAYLAHVHLMPPRRTPRPPAAPASAPPALKPS